MRMIQITLTATAATVLASPVFAASGPFFSLRNTDFVVTLSFLAFIGVLFYYKVPSLLGGMLDQRATGIQAEINEARSLREDAQTLLASYERKQQDVQAQADRIVAAAKDEANIAAEQARAELGKSIERRLIAAEEQIASAEASAVKEVRDQSVVIAVSVAGELIAKQMTAASGNALIDDAIVQVETKLH